MDCIALKFLWMDALEFQTLSNTRKDIQKLLLDCHNWALENSLHPPILSENSAILIAYNKLKDEYIGFIQYFAFGQLEEADECYISWIFVTDTYRKLGIAKQLIKELQEFIMQLSSYKFITSCVLKTNVASQKLHRDLGFKNISKDQFKAFTISDELANRLDILKWEKDNGIS